MRFVLIISCLWALNLGAQSYYHECLNSASTLGLEYLNEGKKRSFVVELLYPDDVSAKDVFDSRIVSCEDTVLVDHIDCSGQEVLEITKGQHHYGISNQEKSTYYIARKDKVIKIYLPLLVRLNGREPVSLKKAVNVFFEIEELVQKSIAPLELLITFSNDDGHFNRHFESVEWQSESRYKNRLTLTKKTRRANRLKFGYQDSLRTKVHETLHWLGLFDEYLVRMKSSLDISWSCWGESIMDEGKNILPRHQNQILLGLCGKNIQGWDYTQKIKEGSTQDTKICR